MFNFSPLCKLVVASLHRTASSTSSCVTPLIASFALRYRMPTYSPSFSKCSVAPIVALGMISVVMVQPAHAETWKVNLQDADIRAFINEVATITNQNFVLDPRINGDVTVISNRALTEEEVYQLFLSVMQVNGIAAIEADNTIKLVPDNIAKQAGIEVDLRGDSEGEAMRTRVVYLDNAPVGEVLAAIRPLMPQSAHAAAVPGANALVLSDRADSLNQIMTLVTILDEGNDSELGVIALQHIDADRMLELINGLTETAGEASTVASQIKLIADSQNQRLLVKGSPDTIAEISQMVAQLDTPPLRQLGGLRVFNLKYASASHVANMLSGLLNNQSLNSSDGASTLEAASLLNGTSSGVSNGIDTAASSAVSNSNTSSAVGGSGSTANGRPFSIISDDTRNSLIINASPELMAEIEAIIPQLDTRRAQVLIQAAIIEISGNDAKQLGVQWALGDANSGYGVINFRNAGVSATDLAQAALIGTGISDAASAVAGALLGIGDSRSDSDGNTQFYGAILQALDSTTDVNLLSMPSIMTLDNEMASILVGQNVPFVTGSYTTAGNSSTNPFQTIERQDVGINLNVIPHIGDNGTIRLEVSQEVSSVVEGSATSNGLITNKSLINTTILADDQQTIALGGLMRDNSSVGEQRVPILGDIPFLGRLFRSDTSRSEKRNLIIFLQPTILRDGGAVASVTEHRYNQMQVMQLVIDSNGTIRKVPLSDTSNSLSNPPAVSQSGTTMTPSQVNLLSENFFQRQSDYDLHSLNPLLNTTQNSTLTPTPTPLFVPVTPVVQEPLIVTNLNSNSGAQVESPVANNNEMANVNSFNNNEINNNEINNNEINNEAGTNPQDAYDALERTPQQPINQQYIQPLMPSSPVQQVPLALPIQPVVISLPAPMPAPVQVEQVQIEQVQPLPTQPAQQSDVPRLIDYQQMSQTQDAHDYLNVPIINPNTIVE